MHPRFGFGRWGCTIHKKISWNLLWHLHKVGAYTTRLCRIVLVVYGDAGLNIVSSTECYCRDYRLYSLSHKTDSRRGGWLHPLREFYGLLEAWFFCQRQVYPNDFDAKLKWSIRCILRNCRAWWGRYWKRQVLLSYVFDSCKSVEVVRMKDL